MALQVWLPFSKDTKFKNYGIAADAVISNYTYPASTEVKGKMYDGCKSNVVVTLKKNYLGYEGSVAFWVYVTPADTQAVYCGNNSQQASTTNRKWTLNAYPTRNDLQSWGCMKDDSTAQNGGWTITGVIPDNTWTHVAWCHDRENQYVYINGVLKGTYAWDSTGPFTFSGNYPIPAYSGRYIQDFRIYDHCLSQFEVKLLSLGEFAHFTLDNANGKASNYNLIKNSSLHKSKPTNAAITKCNDVDTYNFSTNYLAMTTKTTGNENNGIGFTVTGIRVGEPITVSVEYMGECTSGTGKLKLWEYKSSGEWWGKNLASTNFIGDSSNWRTASVTITPSSLTDNKLFIHLAGAFGGNWSFQNLMVEYSQVATPWVDGDGTTQVLCMNSNDPSESSYAVLEPGASIQPTGNDGGRYEMCTYIYNSNGCVSYALPNVDLTHCSVIINSKLDSLGDSGSNSPIMHSLPENNSIKNRLFGVIPGDYRLYSYKDGNGVLTDKYYVDGKRETILQDRFVGKWHHLAVSDVDLTNWGSVVVNKDINSDGGKTSYWVGCVSDLRIFTTPLTDADVAMLYASEYIDDYNQLHGYVFKEDESNNFTKTGIISSSNITEHASYSYNDHDIIEPDGSNWTCVFYMDPQEAGSNGSWANYKSNIFADIDFDSIHMNWYSHMDILNKLTKFEFIYEQKQNASAAVERFRWSQTKNPLDCVFADAARANCTYVTNGYTAPLSTYGGLWKQNGAKAFLLCNDGTSTHSFGQVCPYVTYNTSSNGVQGWNAKWIGTGGYIKLWVRIDKNYANLPVSIKSNTIKAININEL